MDCEPPAHVYVFMKWETTEGIFLEWPSCGFCKERVESQQLSEFTKKILDLNMEINADVYY